MFFQASPPPPLLITRHLNKGLLLPWSCREITMLYLSFEHQSHFHGHQLWCHKHIFNGLFTAGNRRREEIMGGRKLLSIHNSFRHNWEAGACRKLEAKKKIIFLVETVFLLKLIPAQKSLFKSLANKQSQGITVMSVSPELCKVLSKLGRQQVPAAIHPVHCIDEHRQHSDSYRSARTGHGGVCALLAHRVLFVSGHSKTQNSLKRHFSWTRKSFFFFVQRWLWGPLAGPHSIWGVTTCSQTFTRKVSLLAKKAKRQDEPGRAWAFGHRNSKVLQAVWPHSPAPQQAQSNVDSS